MSDIVADNAEILPPVLPEIPKITERERRFGVAYFELSLDSGSDLGVGPRAYRRAFPHAEQTGEELSRLAFTLLHRPSVQSLISQLRVALSMRSVMPAERILQEIERIATANILDIVRVDEAGKPSLNLSDLDLDTAAAISAIRVKPTQFGDETIVTMYNKADALKVLAKIHGMITERKRVEGQITVNMTQAETQV